MATKMKIRKGDTVRILRGRDRGKTGVVMVAFPEEGRVLVEGMNMVKKHVKARRSNEKGQRVTVAAPLRAANVQVVCPQCKKNTRVKMQLDGDTKLRVCRKCGAALTSASK